ncbi:protein-L-isoaspartate(D-aspartate) O-methyltransferase [Rhizobiaceae sp. 2RAB30]
MTDFAQTRETMVEREIVARGIRDAHVLAAMRTVPREEFVPERLRRLAYDDGPLPIGEGQTISQPYVVALMIEAAALRPGERALEIGTGSGYAAALMGQIASEVFTVERHAVLADRARSCLERLGYANIRVETGDGPRGLPDKAPFDVMVASACGPGVPETWKEQLAAGGRIVMPVGGRHGYQDLVKLVRGSDGGFAEEMLGGVRFVPLIGAQGWPETAGRLRDMLSLGSGKEREDDG